MHTEDRWVVPKPYHYVYMIYQRDTGLYYIGVRSSYNKPEKDLYFGSGALLWQVYHLQGYYSIKQGAPVGWDKYIVATFPDRVSANKYEAKAIAGELQSPFCLNCTNSARLRLKQLTKN